MFLKNSRNIIEKIGNLPLPVKTSLIYMICSVLQKGIAFLIVPIYTRMIPSEQYGVYSLYQSWDSILCIFATLNMWNYLFNNGMLKYSEKKNEFTSALMGLSWTLSLGLFIIYLLFHKWISEITGLSEVIMLLMFCDFFLRPAYEYWCSRQRFEYNIKKYAITALLIAAITPIVSILLIKYANSYKPQLSGTALIFAKVFCAGIVYLAVIIVLLKKNCKLYNKEIWKYALKFNIPLVPHFLSSIILSQSDRIMIGAMCGESKTGIYSVAYSVAAVMLILNTAVMDSIIPWVYKKMKANDYSKISEVGIISLIVIAIFNLLVAIFAPEIIAIMAPEEYRIAMYIIPPVAISNVFIFMFNLYANIEYFYEETKLVAIASCISAIANIILNYIFINMFGFIAAGYTTLACYIVYALCHYVFMKRVLKKHSSVNRIYNNRILWIVAVSAILCSFSVMLLYELFIVRLIIAIIILFVLVIKYKSWLGLLFKLRKEK